MTLIAGVDVGNSTTEIVITRDGVPVAWDRRPTRGHKGSIASVQAAAALLRSIERTHALKVNRVVVAPWFPVTTRTATVHETPPDTGAIQLIANATHSVVGNAHAIGKPWNITVSAPAHDVIAVVPAHVDFETAATVINDAIASGTGIVGVAIANDEAVLISARVTADIPMVDRVDVEAALAATLLFIEVRPAGGAVTTATDVWALKSGLALSDAHDEALGLISRWVRDERAVVIGYFPDRTIHLQIPQPSIVELADHSSQDLFAYVHAMSNKPIGHITSLLVAGEQRAFVRDLWAVDISEQLNTRGLRLGSHSRSLALATLTNDQASTQANLVDVFGVPVTVGASEAHAAALGAHTTPGSSDTAVVLDIGGGTIDLIDSDELILSAAGAGDMLTAAVAHCLNVPRGAADWIKRGPAQRVESPSVVLTENGSKSFVDDGSIPSTLVGSLVAHGPSGFLPFGTHLAPAEWRIMRQALKTAVLGNNVSRLISSLDSTKSIDVIVVGGPAADDELLPVIAEQSGIGGLGRGNVAGTLGHRYAVAFGLTLMA